MPETAVSLRGLYAITPEMADAGQLLRQVEDVLRGGCRWLQYRDKKSPAAERRRRADSLLVLCHRYGARLIINDDLELAVALDADGVHLGRDDGHLAAARATLGVGKVLGASCYDDFALAQRAVQAGADYVAFGAVYPSLTKPGAVPASLDLFRRCRSELSVPACAIGGITVDNAPPVIAAGASLLAVITDLFSAPDIAVRAAAYQRLSEESPS